MSDETPDPDRPPTAATEPVPTGEVEQAVVRLAEILGVDRDAARARDAVRLAVARGDGREWLATLARGLTAMGLRGDVVRGRAGSVFSRVAPGAPMVLRARLGGEPGLIIVSERIGSRVRVEPVTGGPARWVSGRKLADGPELAAVAVDRAQPLAGLSDGHALHGGHPSPLRRLAVLARLDRGDLATIAVYSASVGVLALTTPIAVQRVVSTVAFGTVVQPLVVLAALLLVALGTSSLFRSLHAYVVEILQRRFFVRVVADLAYRLPRVRRDALDGRHGPELVNRFFDVFIVQKASSSLLLGGLELVLTALVGSLVLAFYHPLLLALDVILMFSVAAIVLLPARRGSATAIDESRRKYEIASWLQELARHDVELKLAGGMRFAEERAAELARRYIDARSAHFRVSHGQFVLLLAVQAMASAALLGLGGWLVIERQLTLGQLVAAELVVTAVVASLAKLGRYLEGAYDMLAGVDKIGHLVDLPTEREGGDPWVLEGPAGVVLHGVHAGYAGRDVIRDGSLAIEPGEQVAVLGAAGSGKSLLVQLLGALRTPTAGRVTLGGRDLRDLDLELLRERIAVLTRPAVIEGTVLDNVRMGRASVDVSRARAALAAVGLEGELGRHADGAHTMLTLDGAPLSASQALRVTLARAIAAAPALLVMDHLLDALDDSALDPVLDTITAPGAPWTLVVVTRDPRIRMRCTRAVRIEDGAIEEVSS